MSKRAKIILGVVAVVLVVGAIAGGDDDEDSADVASTAATTAQTQPEVTSSTEPEPERHRGSQLACRHYGNVLRDVAAGILTPEEIREKAKEIEGDASIATQRIQVASIQLLASVTQLDGDAFAEAVTELSAACAEAGWPVS